MLLYNYERGYFIMDGYVKIKASEIPFYISLAEDGYDRFKVLDYKREAELTKKNWGKSIWYKPSTWFLDTGDYRKIYRLWERDRNMEQSYINIKDMLVKAKDRDIYIDVDSFDLLEKENV